MVAVCCRYSPFQINRPASGVDWRYPETLIAFVITLV